MSSDQSSENPNSESDPFAEIRQKLVQERETYRTEVLESRAFQDALKYTQGIASDFLLALSYVRLQGTRYAAQDDYLIFRFSPSLVESAISVQMLAHEGLQNAARRELRYILEATIKLSSRDFCNESNDFESRLAGLAESGKRFEDYVGTLHYFDEFKNPQEMNGEILSLYSELSTFVHASVPNFETAMNRSRKGEPAGQESVSTLNRFNKLYFRVLDIALVRIFHGIGLSLAGDTFVHCLDDQPKWRFHKGKFTERMSRCFDYKAERQPR